MRKKRVKFYFDCISLALLFTILLEQFSWYFIQPVTYLANTLCCRIVLQTVVGTLSFIRPSEVLSQRILSQKLCISPYILHYVPVLCLVDSSALLRQTLKEQIKYLLDDAELNSYRSTNIVLRRALSKSLKSNLRLFHFFNILYQGVISIN